MENKKNINQRQNNINEWNLKNESAGLKGDTSGFCTALYFRYIVNVSQENSCLCSRIKCFDNKFDM